FFFSSRRRHTRFSRDWSSDVCSSDLQLKNQDSSIHWHGLLLPAIMDGVPGFNQYDGIKPGQSFKYHFKIRQNGTYWYHAHSKGQIGRASCRERVYSEEDGRALNREEH